MAIGFFQLIWVIIIITISTFFAHYFNMILLILPILNVVFFIRMAKNDTEANR